MRTIERTSRAKTDAIEIWARIADVDEIAADRQIDQFEERLKQLSEMPESAQRVDFAGPNIRRSVVGSYAIYFRPIENGIQVIRILHGSRATEGKL